MSDMNEYLTTKAHNQMTKPKYYNSGCAYLEGDSRVGELYPVKEKLYQRFEQSNKITEMR